MTRHTLLGALLITISTVLARTSWATGDDWKLPPENARLTPGPGADLVTTSCMLCHSVDYIATQPRLNRAQWKATVTKMQQKYGAPVPADKVEAILEYLVRHYGRAS